jgi:hypothetical protein
VAALLGLTLRLGDLLSITTIAFAEALSGDLAHDSGFAGAMGLRPLFGRNRGTPTT